MTSPPSLKSSVNPNCPLCGGAINPFYQAEIQEEAFFECDTCHGISRPTSARPTAQEEKARYEEHHNDVFDIKYQQFVSPITSHVIATYSTESEGLDFGSGTGPVISKVLSDAGYPIRQYDPFFCNDPSALDRTYDYVVCCEVIEHFHNPAKEFLLLKRLLKGGGQLCCMTYLFRDNIDFKSWHYRRDPTHVFIYQEATIHWICREYGFDRVQIDGRLIVFTA